MLLLLQLIGFWTTKFDYHTSSSKWCRCFHEDSELFSIIVCLVLDLCRFLSIRLRSPLRLSFVHRLYTKGLMMQFAKKANLEITINDAGTSSPRRKASSKFMIMIGIQHKVVIEKMTMNSLILCSFEAIFFNLTARRSLARILQRCTTLVIW